MPANSATRLLNLAIAWFVAVPIFVVGAGYVTFLAIATSSGDCWQPNGCERAAIVDFVPSLLLVVGVIAALVLMALGLSALAARRPAVAFPFAGVLGAVLLAVAAAAIVITGSPVALPFVVIWPGWPGLALANAAVRWRRERSASA